SLEVASGGAIRTRGTATLSGDVDLEIEISALALAPFRAYAGADAALDGELAGNVRVQGAAADPASISADLALRAARFALGDIAVAGAIAARVEIAHALRQPSGRFELDAGNAELRYGGAFTKPAGTPASIRGRIVTDEKGGLATDDLELRIRDFEATGSARIGPPLRVDVGRASVDLTGWEALVPALAAAPPSGRVRAEGLRFVGEPRGLTGSIHLEDVRVKPQQLSAPITARGELIARGSELESRGLTFAAAGQPIAVDLRLRDLFGTPRYEVDTRMDAVDANALVTAFAGKPDTLQGPLSLKGSYRGALHPGQSALEALNGEVALDIEKGRLAGVSLLQATFAQLGALGSLGAVALDAGRLFGGRDLQRFYGDEFESIRARLRIVDGVIHAEPLTLLYSAYGAQLTGTLHLSDLSLDMQGRLNIYEDVDASIARNAGARSYQPSSRSIPLASVRGTLDAPKVQVAGRSGLDFATGYAKSLYGEQLKGILDKELGKDAGRAIGGVLEGILGGSAKEPPPTPENH
ncbi:MAG TPA: AsmA-like C-terminal region-containing protein, partial [Myxococcota bacterium]